MLKIKHILFPVDFSDRASSAAPFVASVAKSYGATVTLLLVIEPLPYALYVESAPMLPDIESLQREAEARLEDWLCDEFQGIAVKRIVQIGDAAGEIVEFARSGGADLIMMPTHGYGPFRRFLLGSVASKVLHDTPCPVWTAVHTDYPPVREHIRCRSILCAVDGSDRSVDVLRWADEFAKEADATLRVVHVLPPPVEGTMLGLGADFYNQLRDRARATIQKLQQTAGIEAPICISVGEIAPAIAKEAIGHGADLVIIGRGTLHEALGRLRAHSYGIIRTAPCPVISV